MKNLGKIILVIFLASTIAANATDGDLRINQKRKHVMERKSDAANYRKQAMEKRTEAKQEALKNRKEMQGKMMERKEKSLERQQERKQKKIQKLEKRRDNINNRLEKMKNSN